MSIVDWFGKKKSKVDDVADEISDEELDEWLDEMGMGEPDLQHQKMYAFVHLALREAVMLNHPELISELYSTDDEAPVMPLLHFWSKAMMILEANGIIDDDDLDDEDEWLPFDEIRIDKFAGDRFNIAIVTLPKPRISPEAYMVAIVHQVGESLVYNGERGHARYFTLEYTEKDAQPLLCEWDDEEHLNFGQAVEPELEAFRQAVLAQLR